MCPLCNEFCAEAGTDEKVCSDRAIWFSLFYAQLLEADPDGRTDYVTLYRSTRSGPSSVACAVDDLPRYVRIFGNPERKHPGSLLCACCGVTILGPDDEWERSDINATLCHGMDVSVRELRNHTARVIAAIESGEAVVLTVHGKPVADIVPRQQRAERRASSRLLSELGEISALAAELGVGDRIADHDTGLSTDDMA